MPRMPSLIRHRARARGGTNLTGIDGQDSDEWSTEAVRPVHWNLGEELAGFVSLMKGFNPRLKFDLIIQSKKGFSISSMIKKLNS